MRDAGGLVFPVSMVSAPRRGATMARCLGLLPSRPGAGSPSGRPARPSPECPVGAHTPRWLRGERAAQPSHRRPRPGMRRRSGAALGVGGLPALGAPPASWRDRTFRCAAFPAHPELGARPGHRGRLSWPSAIRSFERGRFALRSKRGPPHPDFLPAACGSPLPDTAATLSQYLLEGL